MVVFMAEIVRSLSRLRYKMAPRYPSSVASNTFRQSPNEPSFLRIWSCSSDLISAPQLPKCTLRTFNIMRRAAMGIQTEKVSVTLQSLNVPFPDCMRQHEPV